MNTRENTIVFEIGVIYQRARVIVVWFLRSITMRIRIHKYLHLSLSLTRFHSFTWFDHNTSCVQHSLACLPWILLVCLWLRMYTCERARRKLRLRDFTGVFSLSLFLHLFSSLHVCVYTFKLANFGNKLNCRRNINNRHLIINKTKK